MTFMSKTKVLALWRDEKMNDDEARILRTPCAEIPAPFGPDSRRDIELLLEAFLEREDALGLAAPQIGVSRRVIAFRNRNFDKKGRVNNAEDCDVLINPRITQARGEPVEGLEGCLSCPDLQMEIDRFPDIKVRALDRDGRKINRRYNDFLARIVQHEMDHLDGKLIVDYEGAAYVPEKNKNFFDRLFKKE
ncbi:MAG: peptide deformylase [Deltaproteobacteria bacterium HGW-Deltaproteobacteria-11]|nr:MAG: peptide deformylase [Deltaproteobacteria bacterium HGW-Deltaproteobacteria-11]